MLKRAAGIIMLLAAGGAPLAQGADRWTEGVHYVRLEPAHRTSTPPGTVEVIEVFSYACPACNLFRPLLDGLKASLPPKVRIVYVSASFNAAEDWPMFQRAFYAAQRLGVAERTHREMFDAIWKSRTLEIVDATSGRLRNPVPSIEQAAAFYEHSAGVKATQFLAVATSFSVDSDMRSADELVKSCKVSSTPTLIINGKYRLDATSAGGFAQMIELARVLIAKESS